MRSINSLLNNWNLLVADVERGYAWSIYEYLNDLSSRALLREALTLREVREEMKARIEVIDRRFLEATVVPANSTLADHFDADDRWLGRVPKVLLAELATDLREDGCI